MRDTNAQGSCKGSHCSALHCFKTAGCCLVLRQWPGRRLSHQIWPRALRSSGNLEPLHKGGPCPQARGSGGATHFPVVLASVCQGVAAVLLSAVMVSRPQHALLLMSVSCCFHIALRALGLAELSPLGLAELINQRSVLCWPCGVTCMSWCFAKS